MTSRPPPREGLFETPFWDWTARHELRLQRCTECETFRYPPGAICPQCLSEAYEWQPLSGRGRLLSWAVFQRQYFDSMPVPYLVVSVATQEGPILVGNLDGGEPSVQPSVGAPVEVWFEDTETVDGRPLTLPQWRLSDA